MPSASVGCKPAGLLAKWELLGAAFASKQLSAADCAVLHYLCDRYDEAKGYAWPSLDTIAADTGRDRKTVRRAIEDLKEAGFLEVESGDRVSSNRYRPRFEVGAERPLQVGAKLSRGRGETVPDVGAKVPPKPTYDPGYEAGGHGGPVAGAPGAGVGGAPEGAAAPAGTARRYPEFWAVYPKATQVFAAEKLLDGLKSDLSQIVAGAAAYARYVAAKPWPDKDRYTAGPVSWLEKRRWLDDYKVQALAAKSAPKARPARKRNPRARFEHGKDYTQ